MKQTSIKDEKKQKLMNELDALAFGNVSTDVSPMFEVQSPILEVQKVCWFCNSENPTYEKTCWNCNKLIV